MHTRAPLLTSSSHSCAALVLLQAHDIGEALQVKLERLPEVARGAGQGGRQRERLCLNFIDFDLYLSDQLPNSY